MSYISPLYPINHILPNSNHQVPSTKYQIPKAVLGLLNFHPVAKSSLRRFKFLVPKGRHIRNFHHYKAVVRGYMALVTSMGK